MGMAGNHDEISFRDMDQKFLLVKDIDMKTRMVIEKSGFHIRQDDNAMLLFGYIDQQAGLSFQVSVWFVSGRYGSVQQPESTDSIS